MQSTSANPPSDPPANPHPGRAAGLLPSSFSDSLDQTKDQHFLPEQVFGHQG